MCQAREHKTSALIPVFLDSSQTVTQLTTQKAVGVETQCRRHRRPIPFLPSISVLLSSDDGPRTGRTMIPQCCFNQAREPQQPPGGQDKQPPSSGRCVPRTLRACPGWPAEGN